MIRHLWAPHAPEYIADPYAMYRRLREEDPVHLSQTNEWIVSRYDDVKFVLKSSLFRSGNRLEWLTRGVQYLGNAGEGFQPIQDAINTFLLFLNPPDHQIIRNFVVKTWSDRAVEDLIKTRIDQQLDQIKGPKFDLVGAYAQPLPVLIISDIMGIPARDYLMLRDLGIKMHRSLDLYHSYKDMVTLSDASKSFVAYFRDLIVEKYSNPDSGLISRLLHRPLRGQLDDRHLISLCIFLFTASEETTASAIGTGLLNLIRNKELYDHLRLHTDQMSTVIEELLRFDAPVQMLGRIAKTSLELGSKTIPEGAALTLVIGSANRDPLQFASPDILVPDRSPNNHLSFSSGTHFCLGDWLGRIQTQLALIGFMDRFPSVSLADEPLMWKKNLAIRGLRSLVVNVN
ncbi:MAG TPA: cytochrome P450 [Cyclobacteriaceae bacterium]|nr:cytochrome P450 [Cyclobacteriaceae bacterium]